MGEPHSLEGCISLGPWGGSGGNKWSFSVNAGIKKIVVVSEKAVNSILFQITDNGKEYPTKFGGRGGKKTDTELKLLPSKHNFAEGLGEWFVIPVVGVVSNGGVWTWT
ncbi:hypothetical protein L1049_013490 [Liquidambar formosana]|uniref:Jacalin-type lectin domain-containing protein n=1 Tax=Liquidambar formosana TaxID=63359 RepID=A0AAP0RLY8_LIQFO